MNPSRGRPRLSGSAKLIRLRSSVFELWNKRKTSLGFGNAKNSEFAEFLLHLRPDQTRNITWEAIPELLENQPLLCSTPLDNTKRRASAPSSRPKKRQRLLLGGPVESSSKSLDIDVTGASFVSRLLQDNPCSQSRDVDITGETSASAQPPVFVSGISGNPYSMLEENECDESTSSSELDSDDDTEFESRMDTIIDELNKSDGSETSSDSEEEDMAVYDDVDICHDECTITALEGFLDELTETATELVPDDREEPLLEIDFPEYDEMTISDSSAVNTGNKSAAKNSNNSADKTSNESPSKKEKKIEDKFKERFNLLTSTNALEDMASLHELPRVIVSVKKLVELCGDKCTYVEEGQMCGAAVTHSTQIVAARAVISWKCCAGHYGKWESSEVLSKNRNENIYLSDCMIAIGIILSGNNYAKFQLLAKAMNLKIIGKSAFLNFQRHCAVPVVNETWQKMKDVVIDIIKDDDNLCLSGDGRNDSPGHCARYSVYSLMEHASKVVVDVEVIDKRECGGNSTVMEREGLRRLLNRLKSRVCITELCTDASSTIIKMIREMKGKYPLLKELFHSLDVWHKAKKLSKSLHKAAKVKGCQDLKAWIEPTVNHFWYCCENANGDAEKLKVEYLSV